jgi:hypothetical protein
MARNHQNRIFFQGRHIYYFSLTFLNLSPADGERQLCRSIAITKQDRQQLTIA